MSNNPDGKGTASPAGACPDDSRKGVLIVVSGPSGVGKSTLIDRFLREDGRSEFSISYTTRQRRVHEVDGKNYHFVDEGTFESMIAKGHFLEWEKVHGNLYGTPRAEILAILQAGKDIILDIAVKGAINISGQCAAARLIFIEPPSVEELINRLSLRGEKEIETRMTRVEEEIARKGEFGYTIVNDDLEKAYGRFRKAIDDIRREDNGKNNC
jgi:guanylate kinase